VTSDGPDIQIGTCRATIEYGEAGKVVVIERADPYILVSDSFLADLDERFAHYGDGILTLHGRDGDVSYGLFGYDPFRQQHMGKRSA
jgi:hypothetical protein